MAIRYTDLDPATNGVSDFVVRKRAPTTVQLFTLFIVILAMSFGGIMFIADKFILAFVLALLLAAAGWYVVVQMQRNNDLVLATEFQNSLFASALGINNKFCMIIRRNGTIVYLDRMFQEMFPEFLHQPKRTIDVLLEQGRVSRAESEKVFTAIERGVYEKVVFEIRGTDSRFNRIIMSIEPILRPSGFILLRGREYVEARSALDPSTKLTPASLMSKTTITLFSYVMDTMNMGVYMTGPSGAIIYVNPVLEQWLGYQDGEILSNNLALQDIIHQSDAKRPESIEPDNYEGEVLLQKKKGGIMKSFINQKIIRDDEHKIMGCTALVHHFIDQTNNKKKKLW
jgi:two-component system, cell cycle sensor histidine kinase and response regulator CckA